MALTDEQSVVFDANLLSEAKLAAKIRVINSKFPNWGSRSSKRDLNTQIEILEIYQGPAKINDVLDVRSSLYDNCGRVIQKGEILDMLVFEDEDGLYLRNICTYLSLNGWQKLKNPEINDVMPLNYTQYHEFASGLDHEAHNIDLNRFVEMMKQDNTVVLDLRSKQAYDYSHVKGALHIGADIKKENLERIVPSKDSVILLYCENSLAMTRMVSLTDLVFPQIYALGYHNVFRLENISVGYKKTDGGMLVYGKRLENELSFTPTVNQE